MSDEHSRIDRLLNVDVPYAPVNDGEAQDRMAKQLEAVRAAQAEDAATDVVGSEDVLRSESFTASSSSAALDASDAAWRNDSSLSLFRPSDPLGEAPQAAPPHPLFDDESEWGEDESDDRSVSRAQAQAYVETLRAHRITVMSADHKVRVAVNGNGTLLEIQLDSSAAKQVRLIELERAVVSAVNEARAQAKAFREFERETLLVGREP